MALDIITWLWGTKYGVNDVNKLAAGIKRNLKQPYRLSVFSDRALPGLRHKLDVKTISNPELIGRGCFCRLRQFDAQWQKEHGFNDRIVSLDLDAIITGSLDDLFNRDESFVILKGVNLVNPNPFNASVTMLRAGCHREVWDDFSLEKANAIPYHEFPDDQGWLWHMLTNAAVWIGGKQSGIYGYRKPGWPENDKFPTDARIIAFIGRKKPRMFPNLPWIREHWREL